MMMIIISISGVAINVICPRRCSLLAIISATDTFTHTGIVFKWTCAVIILL